MSPTAGHFWWKIIFHLFHQMYFLPSCRTRHEDPSSHVTLFVVSLALDVFHFVTRPCKDECFWAGKQQICPHLRFLVLNICHGLLVSLHLPCTAQDSQSPQDHEQTPTRAGQFMSFFFLLLWLGHCSCEISAMVCTTEPPRWSMSCHPACIATVLTDWTWHFIYKSRKVILRL